MSKIKDSVLYHVAFEPQSGVWSMIKNLIKEQVSTGYHSSCVIYYSDKNYYDWIVKETGAEGIVVHFIKVKQSRFARLLILFNSGLSRWINSENKDKDVTILLTYHDAHFSGSYLPFALKNRSSSLIIFHGCPNGLIHSNYLKLIIHWFFNFLLVFSKGRFITVSDKDIELIRNKLFLPKSHFKTIYNGVPNATVIEKVKNKKDFVVGFIGTLDTRKQWWIAVDAVKEANKHDENIILKIAGDGPDSVLLEVKIANNPSFYNYVGKISDPINNFYQDVDLIIMTSSLEGLPMVILEAFSLGIPVISTAVGGIPEVINNGFNGYLIDENPVSIGDQIAYLSNNPDEMALLSKNALSSFESNFTIKKCSDNYLETFRLNRINVK